jgi:hypothetical protein
MFNLPKAFLILEDGKPVCIAHTKELAETAIKWGVTPRTMLELRVFTGPSTVKLEDDQ